MPTHHTLVVRVLGAALALGALASVPADSAHASDCQLPRQLSHDPLASEGFTVLDAKQLYRVQDRPYMHIPTGAKLLVRAPAGVTEADLHRAALCNPGATSPLSVPGARLMVRRSGDLYELHVTAEKRSAALEIRDRALALKR
jgi:hypothetical protein